jgi:hypothetical protein
MKSEARVRQMVADLRWLWRTAPAHPNSKNIPVITSFLEWALGDLPEDADAHVEDLVETIKVKYGYGHD